MIESQEIFKREFDESTYDIRSENPLSLKSLTNTDKSSMLEVLENETFVNEDTIKIKNEGVVKEMVVVDGKVVLQEVQNG